MKLMHMHETSFIYINHIYSVYCRCLAFRISNTSVTHKLVREMKFVTRETSDIHIFVNHNW